MHLNPQSTEASSPHLVSATRQPSPAAPGPRDHRNIPASSSWPKTASSASPPPRGTVIASVRPPATRETIHHAVCDVLAVASLFASVSKPRPLPRPRVPAQASPGPEPER